MLETAEIMGQRADMIVHGCLPCNAEPPPAVLAGSDITRSMRSVTSRPRSRHRAWHWRRDGRLVDVTRHRRDL